MDFQEEIQARAVLPIALDGQLSFSQTTDMALESIAAQDELERQSGIPRRPVSPAKREDFRNRPIRAYDEDLERVATFTEVNADGQAEYTREVPLLLRTLSVQLRPADDSAKDLQDQWPTCYAMMFESKDPQNDPLDQCHMVLAAYPYSRGFHDSGRFVLGYRHAADIDSLALAVLDYAQPGWRALLVAEAEEHGRNPLDSRGGIRTALLVNPWRANPRFVPGTDFGLQRWTRDSKSGIRFLKQNEEKRPRLVYGVVQGLEQCKQSVLTAPAIRDAFAYTESGEVFTKFWGHHSFSGAQGALLVSFERVSLHESLRGRGHGLMEHALELALAGPPVEKLDDLPAVVDKASGKPRRLVETQALRIYLSLLWNLQTCVCKWDKLGMCGSLAVSSLGSRTGTPRAKSTSPTLRSAPRKGAVKPRPWAPTTPKKAISDELESMMDAIKGEVPVDSWQAYCLLVLKRCPDEDAPDIVAQQETESSDLEVDDGEGAECTEDGESQDVADGEADRLAELVRPFEVGGQQGPSPVTRWIRWCMHLAALWNLGARNVEIIARLKDVARWQSEPDKAKTLRQVGAVAEALLGLLAE